VPLIVVYDDKQPFYASLDGIFLVVHRAARRPLHLILLHERPCHLPHTHVSPYLFLPHTLSLLSSSHFFLDLTSSLSHLYDQDQVGSGLAGSAGFERRV
jgi:hypothetical protein